MENICVDAISRLGRACELSLRLADQYAARDDYAEAARFYETAERHARSAAEWSSKLVLERAL